MNAVDAWPQRDDSLRAKVVVVTGSSRGIGRATALAFAARGAVVAVNHCKSHVVAESVVAQIRAHGGMAEVFEADVREAGQVEGMVKAVEDRWGRLDVLVNCAGIVRDNLVGSMDEHEWTDVMNVNVHGAFRATRAVIRPMMLARRGCIINVSSVAATKGGRGQANYAASKAALEGFTKALAVELAPRGIRVNAVAPGIIETDMTERVRSTGGDEALSKILLRRFGLPNEVAEAIVFLASDAAAYITGVTLAVDGGFKMA